MDFRVTQDKERLDRWLANQLPDMTRSRLQKLIEGGQVHLNGEICTTKKTLVSCGDTIALNLPDPEPSLTLKPEDIPLDILYEDTTIIIVNKSAGMVVHPAPGHYSGTLVNALLHHCHDLAGIGGIERPGIVHRLDKDTTGAIVVAKTDFALQHLQKQIQSKTARREYLGIIYGTPKTTAGKIDAPVGRHLGDRKKMAVVPIEQGGRNAITHWQVLERLGNYTLMQFRLETGRTHQIRVHSAHFGHPLIGDITYGSRRSLGVNLSGQALHAHRLCLEHPLSGEPIEAIAPLPSEFTKLLDILRKRNR
ncbi:RluA family pseudouridine synthase [Spirulina sp. 06S082]|uniref:RluA family pseudouridine synthase n=1 Tax=Spirulina sp. 06S082 TaxID=3110248 RepID=UPI002B214CA6|nr:RluA family pseudouridine synthase [Spirulina sp. 06S082]MEA5467978.1 RluA family pseudouridine synthase [Spirulina sp. 06S082]